MMRAILGPVVLLSAIAAGAPQAQAGFHICNTTDFSVSVAIGYVDRQQGWVGQGWWVVDAGVCKAVINTPLDNRYYYYYAKRADRNSNSKFRGETSFCIQLQNFKLFQAQYGKDTQAECSGAGLESANFRKVDTKNQPDYSVTLRHRERGEGESAGPEPQLAPAAAPQLAPATASQSAPATAPQAAPTVPRVAPPPPVATPAGGAGGTACQRFPNLC